ncbi:hypothetical protein ABBQ32_004725 [Trebouxia sp. C0010 RCD-2024]
MKYIRDRGMKATKIFATLMALGVVASAIFGMTQAGKDLVDKTLYTVGLYTGFADDVFEGAYNITTDAQQGLGIFDGLSQILNVDVNVSGMNSNIQCLSPWLNSMKDPTDISTDLTTLKSDLAVFDPSRSRVSSGLPTYSTATNYAAAANALPTPATSAQIEDVKNKLLLLFGTGTDLGKRLADVSNILQALRDLSALHADSASSTPGPAGALQALVDDLTSLKNAGIQLSNTDLPPLIPELSGQYSGYNGVQPCFDTMLYQMQHINETVIALPRAMQVSYNLLFALNSGMESLVTGPSTNPQTLASALTAFQATLPFLGSTNTIISQLPNYIASTLASHTQLTLSLSYLADRDTALAYQAYVTYIASPQAAGDYSTFRTAQTVAASSLSAIQADTLTLTSTPDSTVLSSASSVAQLVIGQQTPPAGVPLPPPQPQVDFVAAMTASRAAILPLDPYIAAEAGEGVAYRALPTPKASVLNAVSTTVSDLNTRFERSISTVRADVSNYNAEILSKIVTLHNETVDKVNSKIEQYLPRVRKYDHMRMTGEYVYFSVVMFVALLTILIVWINFQWGASFFTFLVIIAMLIYSIIGTVLLLLAVVGHDECGNAETQIFALIDRFNVDTGSFNATVLAGYYLKAEGGSLNAIVRSATGVNFAAMQSTINQTITNTVTDITGSYTLRYKMLDQVNAMYGLQRLLLADVEAVQRQVQFEQVHPLYLSTKELACCNVVDVVGNLWLAMFMAGWFAAALMVAMMCYIRRLDELPKKRCCGCALRSYKEFLDPEDKKLLGIKNKGKYMPAGSEGSIPG